MRAGRPPAYLYVAECEDGGCVRYDVLLVGVCAGRVRGAGFGAARAAAPGFVIVSIPGEPFLALTGKILRC
ncbi:Uncharacterised protein [Actinomyces viscosus]|uniref:Uncharacterized protein n=1 Tax=Actinomyces viscosus TaxID=1656 RepID=A0A3S4VYJ7_ACTVI|nr:Uncharacterised protein [Actinomyces viscosus]